jgi:aryl-alcohol dehydrogenase-like predicted oxidoreductase
MRYKLLGHSGLRVSELCLGTMTFGEEWGWGADFSTCAQMFEAFASAGGNFVDTANLYTNGTSERYVGQLVASDRDRWVVATKYTLNTGQGDLNTGGNHRKNMVQAVEASLKRLNLNYIDLLWLHAWDFTTPVEEVMRAFDDLVRASKVLYIGISDTPAWIVAQANTLAQLRGWTPFIGLQIEYSLKQRTPERELLPMAAAMGLGVTAWSPLGGGVLTGKYNQETPSPGRLSNPESASAIEQRDLEIAATVLQIAAEVGCSPAQVALNWIRHQSGVIPIIGARSLHQLQENLNCLTVSLSPEQLQSLHAISQISLGFPHDFLNSTMVQDFAFGGALQRLDL